MRNRRSFPIAIVVLLMASLACSAVSNLMATPTPVPTSTPIPTNTPLPSPTPEIPEVSEILSDDFSSDTSGWGTGTDAESSVEYVNGGLQAQVFSANFITWSNPDQEKYSNVHIDVAAQNNSADELSMFGIICHEQDSQAFYYLGVAADGYYAIAKSEVDQDNVYYADGNSSVIPTDSTPFTIGADCGNGNLALYVNGQQLATAQDSSFSSGYVGLFAWSGEATNAADVTFDNFVMTTLP
jgi:hypothetical protein